MEMRTGGSAGTAHFGGAINALPVRNRNKATAAGNVVTAEIDAVLTLLLVHTNHLEDILEFITLKVNSVINSMLWFFRGEKHELCRADPLSSGRQ
jgi:hypothetical protein